VAGTTQQAAPNATYSVTSTSTATVVITLPRNEDLQVGDKVKITGQSAARWQVTQNATQYVVTTNLSGNVVPGTSWTPRTPDTSLPRQNWWATASSASGNRIAAVANPGGIYMSSDGGATWTRSNAPTANWSWVATSSDGSRLAAVAANGFLYTSTDYGQTWTARTSSAQAWQGVTISDDGQRIVGVVDYGAMYVSTNGGATFTPVAGTAGLDWRAVAGSADGMRLVAVAASFGDQAAQQGIYVSVDGGTTWTRRLTTGNWTYAASSADGMRMAALDNGGYPWISDDGGVTWTQRFGYSNWSGLGVSGDGRVVSALEPRNDTYGHTGYVFVNTQGGADPWDNWYGENRWYRALSMSFDGNWLVVGDTGADGTGGSIYTSQGNRTAGGTQGSITGGQNDMVEVQYQGGGRFTITGSSGGPFGIR
jgi:photosystem II stability/assembly factor-like uncharacterized protein